MNLAPQAQTRNWRAYLYAVGGGALITGTVVWFIASNTTKPPPERIDIREDRATMERLADRDFTPPQKPLAPPTTPIPVAPKPIQEPKHIPISQSAPPKPMSSMFATTDDKEAMTEDIHQQPVHNPYTGESADQRPGESDASKWLASAANSGKDFVTSPFLPPISKFMIQAGTIIQATTQNSANTDLPGDIVALINNTIYDTPTGQVPLIPATSKLYGRISDQMKYGQTRGLVAWTRILWPDGSSQNIGAMPATDASGASGIDGEVDHHTLQMAGAIGLSAMMTIIGQAGALINSGQSGTVNIGAIGAQGAGQEAQSIGREFVTRELNRNNTIILPQGSQVAVMITKDIALPPYVDRRFVSE